MTLAVFAVAAVLIACAGIFVWVRRPIAMGTDAGRLAAEATIRAALAAAEDRPVLAVVERLAA